ncbi:MAG: sigma-54-dependent Fis family transcriptional regulator [Nitrospiraceae bacterium]|nr:MAG: sigma-54-dependent Fis family transcriptional regulator [Nitrospiraceae bacterium]
MNNLHLPVLIVDDEKQILLSYTVMLRTAGIENVITMNDSRKVLTFLSKEDVAAIVLDLNMPHISGIDLLDKIKEKYPHISIIIVTAINDIEKAVECMKKGASDYLVKPVEKSRFVSSIQKTLELSGLRNEVSSLKEHVLSLRQHLLTDKLEHEDVFSSIYTNSKKMRAVFHYVEAIGKSSNPVFIAGETGVGKELMSRAVHAVSGLRGNFVAVNVAGLDDTMFSDTLFGHVKGAYTGADKDREGLIVRASGGTLLLDEIGDLNELTQVKLLRLMEEGVYYPLGSDTPQKSNARIIGTTNRDLQKRISQGKFRKDLYYRLCTIQIQIPPLRERTEDIPVLLNYFLEESSENLKKKKPSPPIELLTLLSNYTFPGNIRELRAMVFDAVAQHKSGILSLDSFRKFIKEKGEHVETVISPPEQSTSAKLDFSGRFPTIKEAEDFLVAEALKRSDGNQGIAASLLGLTRQALNKRIKRSENHS